MASNSHSKVLKFWFPNDKYQDYWFQGKVNHKLNQIIKDQFSDPLEKAENGLLECKTIDDMLSHIILFDQLTRSIYLDDRNRNLDKALKLSLQLLDKINDFPPNKAVFVLLPLRHAKDYSLYLKLIDVIQKYDHKDNIIWSRFVKRTYLDCPLNIILDDVEDDISKLDISKWKDVIDEQYYESFKDSDDRNLLKNPLCKTIRKFLEDNKCKKVIVSLSGGVDSMVIACCCVKLGYNIVCLHINYKNREESNREHEFLKLWTKLHGIPLYSITIEHIKRGKIDRNLYEESTRNIRYGFYQEMLKKLGGNGIFLGHHADDLAENVFYNAIYGRHILDLSAMASSSIVNGVLIYRPMLSHHKEDVFELSHKYGVPYFKDTTPKWSRRGKFRNELRCSIEEIVGDVFMENLYKLGLSSMNLSRTLKANIYDPLLKSSIGGKLGIYLDYSKYVSLNETDWKYLLMELLHGNQLNMISNKLFKRFIELINLKEEHEIETKKYKLIMFDHQLIIWRKGLKGRWKSEMKLGYQGDKIFDIGEVVNGDFSYSTTLKVQEFRGIQTVKHRSDICKKDKEIFLRMPSKMIKLVDIPIVRCREGSKYKVLIKCLFS